MSRTPPIDDNSKPGSTQTAADRTAEIEERIDRLEKRLEETIGEAQGDDDRHHRPKLDDSETADPLRRSVERVNERRQGRASSDPAPAGGAPASPERTK